MPKCKYKSIKRSKEQRKEKKERSKKSWSSCGNEPKSWFERHSFMVLFVHPNITPPRWHLLKFLDDAPALNRAEGPGLNFSAFFPVFILSYGEMKKKNLVKIINWENILHIETKTHVIQHIKLIQRQLHSSILTISWLMLITTLLTHIHTQK